MLMFWGFIFPIALNHLKHIFIVALTTLGNLAFKRLGKKKEETRNSYSSIFCLSRFYLGQYAFKVLSFHIISLSIETLVPVHSSV